MPTAKKRTTSSKARKPSSKKRTLLNGRIRLATLQLTAASTLMIAIVLATFLFFANPGISEAATAGRITGPAGKCLDNEDNKLVNKNPVVLWTCDGTKAQEWTLPGDGTIRSGAYCLDIPGASTKTKTYVQLYKCNGTKAQKWTFSSAGAVVNPNSGLCLDANKTTNGTRLWMWTCNKTAAQKWVVPKTAPAPQPTTPAPTPTPSTMPIGDMPGWKHIFAEDFNVDAAEGAFAAANGSVLPAAYKDKFWTYPDGWGDTLKNGKYMPSQTMSVKDGLFRVRMRNEGGVNKVGALLPKLVNKKDTGGDNMGQLYGRYSIRFKTDTTRGYKIAWLLWPDSTGGIQHSPAGEIDFPEGELDGNILGFVHPTEVHGYSGGQFSYDTKQSFGTGWHVATIEWSPGLVTFIFDGKTLGQTKTHIPDTKMSWVIQSETAMIGPLPAKNSQANVYVDWVSAWSYKP